MQKAVPILDSTRRVHFQSLTAFLEGVRSSLDNEWLFVAPKITVKLFDSLNITLDHQFGDGQLLVKATPTYWRGPYLGMQVECADAEQVAIARSLLDSDSTGAETVIQVTEDDDGSPAQADTDTIEELPPEVLEEGAGGDDLSQPADFEEESTIRDSLDLSEELPSSAREWLVKELTDSGAQSLSFVGGGGSLVGEKSAPPGPEPVPEGTPEIIAGFASPTKVPDAFLNPFFSMDRSFYLPERVTYYELLGALAAHELTGTASLRTDNGTYSIHVRSGQLVAIDPPGGSFDEHLARVLSDEGWVNPGQIRSSLRTSRSQAKTMSVVLYEKGILSLDILARYLRAEKEELLRQVLSLPFESEYAVHPSSGFLGRTDPVRIPLISGLAMYMRQTLLEQGSPELERMVVRWVDSYPRYRENFVVQRNALSLTRQETEVVETMLSGLHCVGELRRLAPFTEDELHILLIMLNHFGFLDWSQSPFPNAEEEDVESLLERRFRHLKGMDHFQRLSLHWASHPRRITQAYKSLAQRYGPGSFLAQHSQGAGSLCKAILKLCCSSHDFLSDAEKRRALRKQRMGRDRIEYGARFLSNQARQNMSRGHIVNAIFLMESALDLQRDEGNMELLEDWISKKQERQLQN